MSALGLLLAAACGDPVVGPDYLGTSMFSVGGSVAQTGALAPELQDSLRLSLFWIGFDSRSRQRPPIEQHASVDDGLARFRMTLFDPPTAGSLTFDELTQGSAGVGIALIVLYADNNTNGALNSYTPLLEDGPDTVLGASASHLVVFADTSVPASSPAGALLGPVDPGYHLFANASGTTCLFVRSADCQGVGRLERVAAEDGNIVLTLYPEATQVEVPNPEVPGGGSGTMPPTNLYGGG